MSKVGERPRTQPQGLDRKVVLRLLNCLGPPPRKPPSPASGPAEATRLPATPSTQRPQIRPAHTSAPGSGARPASEYLRPGMKGCRPAKSPRTPNTLTYQRPRQQRQQLRLSSPGRRQKRLPKARCTLGNVVLCSDQARHRTLQEILEFPEIRMYFLSGPELSSAQEARWLLGVVVLARFGGTR